MRYVFKRENDTFADALIMNPKTASVVISAYNEIQTVGELVKSLVLLNSKLEKQNITCEYIIVDDCSNDGTHGLFKDALSKTNIHWSLIKLRYNVGQVLALSCGISYCVGNAIFVTDSDLQFPIQDADQHILRVLEGYDIVSSYRIRRDDPIVRTYISRFFSYIASKFFGLPLKELGCNFRAFSRAVISKSKDKDDFVLYNIMKFSQDSKAIDQLPIEVSARKFGKSSYNFYRLANFYLSMVVKSSTMVVNLIVLTALTVAVFTFLYILSALGAVESNSLNAPMQIISLSVISLILLLNLYSNINTQIEINKVGYPEIEKIDISKR